MKQVPIGSTTCISMCVLNGLESQHIDTTTVYKALAQLNDLIAVSWTVCSFVLYLVYTICFNSKGDTIILCTSRSISFLGQLWVRWMHLLAQGNNWSIIGFEITPAKPSIANETRCLPLSYIPNTVISCKTCIMYIKRG